MVVIRVITHVSDFYVKIEETMSTESEMNVFTLYLESNNAIFLTKLRFTIAIMMSDWWLEFWQKL